MHIVYIVLFLHLIVGSDAQSQAALQRVHARRSLHFLDHLLRVEVVRREHQPVTPSRSSRGVAQAHMESEWIEIHGKAIRASGIIQPGSRETGGEGGEEQTALRGNEGSKGSKKGFKASKRERTRQEQQRWVGTSYLSKEIAQMEVETNLAYRFWQEFRNRGRFPKSRASNCHNNTNSG